MRKNLIKLFVLTFILGVFSQAQASTLRVIQVHSDKMNKDIAVSVILPDAYQNSKRPVPVLYLLHGAGGNHMDWPDRTNIKTLADKHNIMVVCPSAGQTSWYFDSPIDPTYQYETFVSSELVRYIDKNYRTLVSRDFRAITGLSMGGHGALFLAIRHKDVFGVVGCQSGGVDIRPFPNNWDIKKRIGPIGKNKDRWDELTVINVAKTLKNKELKICIDCGTSDFFLKVNRALHQQLLKDKIDHIYIERPGSHNWDCWRETIKYQMLFISNCFEKSKLEAQKYAQLNTALIAVPKLEKDGYDWYRRHEDIKKLTATLKPEVVLIGDSITHYWAGKPKARIARGKQAWQNVFGNYRTINMGFGWDRIQNVLWRIDHGAIDRMSPDYFIVNIGTNNLADAHARPNTPTEIAQGIEEICSQIQRHHPDTQIILMAIFPRGPKPGTSHRQQITAINKLIQPLGKKENIHFLNITNQFLNDQGEIPKELMADYLHPTAKGYTIWTEALKKEIQRLNKIDVKDKKLKLYYSNRKKN